MNSDDMFVHHKTISYRLVIFQSPEKRFVLNIEYISPLIKNVNLLMMTDGYSSLTSLGQTSDCGQKTK